MFKFSSYLFNVLFYQFRKKNVRTFLKTILRQYVRNSFKALSLEF